eukprot:GHRQ01037754.1.p1 GENE.GHRQ01037754.1~~GHRQ01037754.1.p1  ORF type:complete len:292 (+),score=84.52 GHRQ01037754.1:643-1518(+)
MRQAVGSLQDLQKHTCSIKYLNVRHTPCRVRPRLPPCTGSRVQLRRVAAAAAEAPDAAAARARQRGRPARKQAPEEEVGEQGMPELPMPLDYQQTLLKSFTLGGIGLHSAEYAVVRVRPAFAGEGRYFVRVPEGTNAPRFQFDDGSLLDEAPFEEGIAAVPVPEEIEDLKVEWFTTYLAAQEEEGYIGTFADFLQEQVLEGELDVKTRSLMLGLPLDEDEPDLEPDLSLEPEDIEQLDASDPSLVRASIGSVTQTDLPFTQLGEGDNRVRLPWLLLNIMICRKQCSNHWHL